ncbi:MAG TPA: hypothetical protein VGO67_02845 [Verrucomicrobiae bacterium]|jgi:hypothetical protein
MPAKIERANYQKSYRRAHGVLDGSGCVSNSSKHYSSVIEFHAKNQRRVN